MPASRSQPFLVGPPEYRYAPIPGRTAPLEPEWGGASAPSGPFQTLRHCGQRTSTSSAASTTMPPTGRPGALISVPTAPRRFAQPARGIIANSNSLAHEGRDGEPPVCHPPFPLAIQVSAASRGGPRQRQWIAMGTGGGEPLAHNGSRPKFQGLHRKRCPVSALPRTAIPVFPAGSDCGQGSHCLLQERLVARDPLNRQAARTRFQVSVASRAAALSRDNGSRSA